jgi:2-polyprenyl-6-methoxyphenol hydroxylase-like FAD-dependent oxidoreductase
VVGGGVAGLAAALVLAKLGGRTVVVETNLASRWHIGETLGPESRPFLETLGIWDEFAEAGHLQSHGKVSAWGSSKAVEDDFIFNPFGNGWQLDRRHFEESLYRAAGKAGAKVVRGAMVGAMEWQQPAWTIDIGPERMRTRWILDATGRSSSVARRLGVKRLMLDRLVAVHVVMKTAQETDADTRTMVESCPEGWWYTALTPSGLRTVSFQTDADLLPAQQWREPAWYRERLTQTKHVGPLLAQHGYDFDCGPQLTSAHSGRVEAFGGEGWLPIGDAAMSFDPLSGLGLIKAMQNGADAAQAMVANDQALFVNIAKISEETWTQFVGTRSQYYAMEKRWPHERFWQRRGAG